MKEELRKLMDLDQRKREPWSKVERTIADFFMYEDAKTCAAALDGINNDQLLTFCVDQQIPVSLDADRAELIAAIENHALKLARDCVHA